MEPTAAAAKQQKSRRLFFALWPNDDVRQQLAVVSRECADKNNGKLMVHMNLHLTLVFLGNVDETRVECVRDVASQIQLNAFSLQLDTPGWFKKPRVAWIGSDQTPDELLALVSQLHTGCIQCGLPLKDACFRPHVSLLRKAQRFQSFQIQPVAWEVHEFVLVQSFTHPEGVEYKVIDRWLLPG